MQNKQPCVYILTNKPHGVLYIGMTAYPAQRLEQHFQSIQNSFVKKYNLSRLVHIELCDTLEQAALREKQLKHWKRDWKIKLIEEKNAEWNDLTHLLF